MITFNKDLKYITFAILPAVIFALLWSIYDHSIPAADGGAYFFESFRYYDRFVSPDQKIPFFEGFIEGIWKIFSDRPWKPISFTFFGVPFLLISNGNISFSLAALAITTIVITIIYAYLLLTLCIERKYAALAAALIGVTPSVQAHALTNFAETAMLASVFATIYYMIKSNFLRDYKNSLYFIIALTVAITIRPVEVVMALILPLLYFLYRGKKKSIFSVHDFLQISYICLLSLTILFICPYIAYHTGVINKIFDQGVDFEAISGSYLLITITTLL